MKKGLAPRILLFAAPALLWAEPKGTTPSSPRTQSESQVRFLCSIQAPYGQWDPLAQFISGRNSNTYSLAMPAQQQSEWSDYSKATTSDWTGLQSRHLNRIDTWRERSLRKTVTGEVAFYPFGGPDAANLLTFFPDASEYVLLGLEPVGCIPAGIQDYTSAYFSDLRRSLGALTTIGFFRTNDMERDFATSRVNGVLPLLLFLVGRAGYQVVDVSSAGITAAGVVAGPGDPVETRGVSIRFTDERRRVRTMRYFSLNLTDSRVRKRPGTLKYFGTLNGASTLVKDASYLMHSPYFSIIRDLILSQSRVIVEDDTGIPYRFFDQTAWDVRLYGSYSDPIERFRRWRQEDLNSAFVSRADPQPLDFAIGYRRRNDSNLLVATRR